MFSKLRLKQRTEIVPFLLVLTQLTGCGLFGSKEERDDFVEYRDRFSGCLNQFGPTLLQYFDGTVSNEKWAYNWDCVIGTMRLLLRYVQPSDPSGYTIKDMHAISETFLVSDKPVSEELIRQTYKVKSALFGGDHEIVTKEQLEMFIDFLGVTKKQTLDFLPYIRNIKKDFTPQNASVFKNHLEAMAKNLGNVLKLNGNGAMTANDLELFFAQIRTLHDLDIPVGMGGFVTALKSIIVGGSETEIQGPEWKGILRAAALSIGFLTFGNSLTEKKDTDPRVWFTYLHRLVFDAAAFAQESLNVWGGTLSFEKLDRFADAVPDEMSAMNKSNLKKAMRAGLGKLLGFNNATGFTVYALDRLLVLFKSWSGVAGHIDPFFEEYGLDPEGVTSEKFLDSLERYKSSIDPDERKHIDRLGLIFKNNVALFEGSSEFVTFKKNLLKSITHVKHYNWIELVIDQAIAGYGSGSGVNGKLNETQFKALIEDFAPLADDLDLIDFSQAQKFIESRHRDINLFTLKSDGNGSLSRNEIVTYIPYVLSIAKATGEVKTDLEELCRLGDQKDPAGWYLMDAPCFRQNFFAQVDKYWRNLPGAIAYLDSHSPEDQQKIMKKIEETAREGGYSDLPVGSNDVSNLIGIIHYVESILYRFDKDGNEWLNTDETKNACPLFKETIKKAGKLTDLTEFLVEPIFTFLVKKGRAPKDGFAGYVELLGWILQAATWNIHADRMSIYKITAFFKANNSAQISGF